MADPQPATTHPATTQPAATQPAGPPPAAPRRPHPLTAHGVTRTDDWYWLQDRDDPAVVAYLEEENDYAERTLASTEALQEELFEEIRSRVRETDAGPPARSGDWWYYSRTEEGRQYPIMCRRPAGDRNLDAATVAADARAGRPDDEVVVLDENDLAAGDYLAVGVFDVSPDHALLAYGTDVDGSEQYTLRFRRLTADADADDTPGDTHAPADLPDVIEGVYYGSAWAMDSRTFYYVRPDEAMRPWQVWCHVLDTDAASDRLVYQEDDERYFVGLELSRSRQRIVITSASKTSSEVRWLDAAGSAQPTGGPDAAGPPDAEVLIARRPGIEYEAEHDGDGWLILTNAPGDNGAAVTNFELRRLDPSGVASTVVAHRPDVKLESVDAFAGFTVVAERSATDGLERLRIIERNGRQHTVDQPEAAYTLLGGQNPEWEQAVYRFGYTSLVTPRTSVDYVVAERRREPVWAQIVPGYDPSRFRTERLWAEAPDGARIPISLVARADVGPDGDPQNGAPQKGAPPALLYGYGAYEMSMDPSFSATNLNLVARGAVFAIAHVRGGGELGRGWYEQGRMEHKVHTFTDFVAAAEALIAAGWADPDRVVARGGSAGGLLMGAVVNMRPDLWRAVVAEVPFVDVVTTMSDTSLPLTVTEWEEWGDPVHDPAAFARMLAYSPYDNVVPRDRYPAIYASAGLNDPRVGYWEPAKWVAKLRSVGAGGPERPVLLRTELGAGHGGPSGRYDTWRDEARVQAFILQQMGLVQQTGFPQ